MQISTSRFSSQRAIQQSGLAAVRISLGLPKFALDYPILGEVFMLMPSRDMLRMEEEPYTALYLKRMEGYGVDKINRAFTTLGAQAKNHGKSGLVLLCFEDITREFCHRRIFAKWWLEKTGEVIDELGPAVFTPNPSAPPKTAPVKAKDVFNTVNIPSLFDLGSF